MFAIFKKALQAVTERVGDAWISLKCKLDGVKRVAGEFVVASTGFFVVSSAHAAGPDLSAVTSAVDFGTVTTAVLGVAAALIVVYIAWKGAKMIIHAVKGG